MKGALWLDRKSKRSKKKEGWLNESKKKWK